LFYPKVSDENCNPLLGGQDSTYLLPAQESHFGWDAGDTVWYLAGLINDAVLNVGVIQDRMGGRTIMQGDIDKTGQEAAVLFVSKYITRMHGVALPQSLPSGSQISLTWT